MQNSEQHRKEYVRFANKNGNIYLSCGFYNGKPTWHYVSVDKMKLPLFLRQAKTGNIDVAEYGKVLFSGWGKYPPENIRKKIEEITNAA